MPFRRVRRPLLALIVLVVALAIGYAVHAVNDGGSGKSSPSPSVSSTR